jgi:hypothetical protein
MLVPCDWKKVLARKPKGKKLLESLKVDARIILKRILNKYDGSGWTGLISLGTETSCNHW